VVGEIGLEDFGGLAEGGVQEGCRVESALAIVERDDNALTRDLCVGCNGDATGFHKDILRGTGYEVGYEDDTHKKNLGRGYAD
jgi:hypothetical protein